MSKGDSILKVVCVVFRDLGIAVIGGLVAVAYFILQGGDFSTYYFLLLIFFVILVFSEFAIHKLNKDTK